MAFQVDFHELLGKSTAIKPLSPKGIPLPSDWKGPAHSYIVTEATLKHSWAHSKIPQLERSLTYLTIESDKSVLDLVSFTMLILSTDYTDRFISILDNDCSSISKNSGRIPLVCELYRHHRLFLMVMPLNNPMSSILTSMLMKTSNALSHLVYLSSRTVSPSLAEYALLSPISRKFSQIQENHKTSVYFNDNGSILYHFSAVEFMVNGIVDESDRRDKKDGKEVTIAMTLLKR